MPGQRVEMRMVFQKQTRRLNCCPSCGCQSEQATDEDVDFLACGLTFKRIIRIEEPPTDSKAEPTKKGVIDLRELSAALAYNGGTSQGVGPPRPPLTAYDETEDVEYYRRVNVVQRQRRAVWELPDDPVQEINQSAQRIQIITNEEISATAATEESSENDSEDFEGSGDDIDPLMFEQILEMDDDDELERGFSRSIIFGSLPHIEKTIRAIQDRL
jgi:hypothetical protein